MVRQELLHVGNRCPMYQQHVIDPLLVILRHQVSSAVHLQRSCTLLCLFVRREAAWNGGGLTELVILTLMRGSRRSTSTISCRPLYAAKCSGVSPYCTISEQQQRNRGGRSYLSLLVDVHIRQANEHFHGLQVAIVNRMMQCGPSFTDNIRICSTI